MRTKKTRRMSTYCLKQCSTVCPAIKKKFSCRILGCVESLTFWGFFVLLVLVFCSVLCSSLIPASREGLAAGEMAKSDSKWKTPEQWKN